jgi:hypothetical protein
MDTERLTQFGWPQIMSVTLRDSAGLSLSMLLGIGLLDRAKVVPAALLGQRFWRGAEDLLSARTIQ